MRGLACIVRHQAFSWQRPRVGSTCIRRTAPSRSVDSPAREAEGGASGLLVLRRHQGGSRRAEPRGDILLLSTCGAIAPIQRGEGTAESAGERFALDPLARTGPMALP